MKYTKRRLDDSMAPTVEEKEKKLREGLLMMGLRYSVFCPGPPGRLSALSIFLCKSVFLWRFCMGARGA
jgi:hypothetical protein